MLAGNFFVANKSGLGSTRRRKIPLSRRAWWNKVPTMDAQCVTTCRQCLRNQLRSFAIILSILTALSLVCRGPITFFNYLYPMATVREREKKNDVSRIRCLGQTFICVSWVGLVMPKTLQYTVRLFGFIGRWKIPRNARLSQIFVSKKRVIIGLFCGAGRSTLYLCTDIGVCCGSVMQDSSHA